MRAKKKAINIFEDVLDNCNGKLSIPAGLNAGEITKNSVVLHWQKSHGLCPVAYYTLFRNGVALPISHSLSFTDSGLEPGSTVRYQICATDSAGHCSAKSISLVVTLKSESGDIPTWQSERWYIKGARVNYEGRNYICVMQHTSSQYWKPDIATSLWQIF